LPHQAQPLRDLAETADRQRPEDQHMMSPHCQAVCRAAQIALEERKGRLRPGMGREYVKALPEDFRPEAWAAVCYTLRTGHMPPIIRQALAA
jgi:hypothetical protein